VNLQHALGTWVPNGVLNFFFKYSYSRRVSDFKQNKFCFPKNILWLTFLQGLKKVKAQGIGVHKPEEILEFGQNDLKVLSDVLGDKLYFFGNEPTTVIEFTNIIKY